MAEIHEQVVNNYLKKQLPDILYNTMHQAERTIHFLTNHYGAQKTAWFYLRWLCKNRTLDINSILHQANQTSQKELAAFTVAWEREIIAINSTMPNNDETQWLQRIIENYTPDSNKNDTYGKWYSHYKNGTPAPVVEPKPPVSAVKPPKTSPNKDFFISLFKKSDKTKTKPPTKVDWQKKTLAEVKQDMQKQGIDTLGWHQNILKALNLYGIEHTVQAFIDENKDTIRIDLFEKVLEQAHQYSHHRNNKEIIYRPLAEFFVALAQAMNTPGYTSRYLTTKNLERTLERYEPEINHLYWELQSSGPTLT